MARQPVEIGDLTFASKKDAKAFFREMLGRYTDGQTIESGDAIHLEALIERHPEAEHKIGCGVKRFYRDATDQPTSCFWIERTDGSCTDFSFHSCVDMKGKSLYQEFSEACREAVRQELIAAKGRHFKAHADSTGRLACDVTGEMIGIDEAHLDHAKPMTFQVIVATFCAAHEIKISPHLLSRPSDAQFVTTFADLAIAERFRQYHRRVAVLRIVKAKKNLSLGGSERLRALANPVLLHRPDPAGFKTGPAETTT